MKKYALPVLILLTILVGMFGGVRQVSASPYSDCMDRAAARGDAFGVAENECRLSTSNTVSDACITVEGIGNLICKAQKILNSIIPVLVALGVVYFVWGVVQYMIRDDAEAKKKGRDRIIFGIIGLAVIIGVWGLVLILTKTFLGDNPNNRNITFPTVQY